MSSITLTRFSEDQYASWLSDPIVPRNPEKDICNMDQSEWHGLLGWNKEWSWVPGYRKTHDRLRDRVFAMTSALGDRCGDELCSQHPGVKLYKNAQSSTRYWAERLLVHGFTPGDLLAEILANLKRLNFLNHITFIEYDHHVTEPEKDTALRDVYSKHELTPKEIYAYGIRENLKYLRFMLTQLDFGDPTYRSWMDNDRYLQGGFQSWGRNRDDMLNDVRRFHKFAPSSYGLESDNGYFPITDMIDQSCRISKVIKTFDRSLDTIRPYLSDAACWRIARITRGTWVSHFLRRGSHGGKVSPENPVLDLSVKVDSIDRAWFEEIVSVGYPNKEEKVEAST